MPKEPPRPPHTSPSGTFASAPGALRSGRYGAGPKASRELDKHSFRDPEHVDGIEFHHIQATDIHSLHFSTIPHQSTRGCAQAIWKSISSKLFAFRGSAIRSRPRLPGGRRTTSSNQEEPDRIAQRSNASRIVFKPILDIARVDGLP